MRTRLLEPLRTHIGKVTLSATIFLNEENATAVRSPCNHEEDARAALSRLGPVAYERILHDSSCESFTQATGRDIPSCLANTRSRALHGNNAGFLQFHWLADCFAQLAPATLFVRVRPDSFFADTFPLSVLPASELGPAVVTWTPCAVRWAPASDQFFVFNRMAYAAWWQHMERLAGSSLQDGVSFRFSLARAPEFCIFGLGTQRTNVSITVTEEIRGCLARSASCLHCAHQKNATIAAETYDALLTSFANATEAAQPAPRCAAEDEQWHRTQKEEQWARVQRLTSNPRMVSPPESILAGFLNIGLKCLKPPPPPPQLTRAPTIRRGRRPRPAHRAHRLTASVCLVGHARTVVYPAVHRSLSRAMSAVRERFLTTLTAVVFAEDAESFAATYFKAASCGNQSTIAGALGNLEPNDTLVLDRSDCATFNQFDFRGRSPFYGRWGNETCATNTLRFAWVQYCFERAPPADLYVRLRPDAYFSSVNMDRWASAATSAVPTVVSWMKVDARASDQVFAFNAAAKRGWWLRTVKTWWYRTMGLQTFEKAPEYVIFGNWEVNLTVVEQDPALIGCLARTHRTISCWNGKPVAKDVLASYKAETLNSSREIWASCSCKGSVHHGGRCDQTCTDKSCFTWNVRGPPPPPPPPSLLSPPPKISESFAFTELKTLLQQTQSRMRIMKQRITALERENDALRSSARATAASGGTNAAGRAVADAGVAARRGPASTYSLRDMGTYLDRHVHAARVGLLGVRDASGSRNQ